MKTEENSGRLLYIENIKVLLSLCVLLFHVNSAFGGTGGWYLVEASSDSISIVLLTLINAILQSFFMGLYFFLSAYFIPKSFMKMGTIIFIKTRLQKLLVPSTFYFFVLNPLCKNIVEKVPYLKAIGFYNLWFPMALLYFTFLYLMVGFFNVKIPKLNFPTNKNINFFMVFFVVICFIVRLKFKIDKMYFSDFTIGYFPQYLFLFCLGILASQNNWLEMIHQKIANVYFKGSLIAIVLLPIIFLFQESLGRPESYFYGGWHPEALFFILWEVVMFTGIILKILTFFQEKFNDTNKVLSLLSRLSYSVYIIQAPFILIMQKIFGKFDFPVFVNVFLIFVFSYLCSVAVSYLMLKIKYLRKFV
ncbi:MAG: acyltransferase [Streptococcaceae bacterium]|jgi:hypothetical protein|nr:acyltransferase [Streptococcaceae bacterium]